MVRGFFTAASGILTQQRTLDVVGNNIANVQTAGFKKDGVTTTTFDDFLVHKYENPQDARYDDKLKPLAHESSVKYVNGIKTNFEQGIYEHTGRTLDVLISGDGFFAVEANEQGDELLTRNGQFLVDLEGYLVTGQGYKVKGESEEPILVGTVDFEINTDGDVYVDGQLIDRLKIAQPADLNTLVKFDEGYFHDKNPDEASTGIGSGSVMQEYYEKSNVDMASEMSKMLAGQRMFGTCSQILKMFDTITQKTVELGRL